MSENKKLDKSYDHVLVGYNFASLSYAYQLHQKGEKFCIIDSQHISLQPTKLIPSLNQSLYSRIPFAPTSEDFDISPSLQNLLGSKNVLEGTPTTFEKGTFKSFLGFGNSKIKELDIVSQYCSTKNIHFHGQPENIWQLFMDAVQDNIFLDQEVTDIDFESKEVTGITLNGKNKLIGKNYVFFRYFPYLFEAVGSEIKALASKMAKVNWWSSVSLIIHHGQKPENCEFDQIYLRKIRVFFTTIGAC